MRSRVLSPRAGSCSGRGQSSPQRERGAVPRGPRRGRTPTQLRPAPPPPPPPRTRSGPAPARVEPSRAPSLPGLPRAAFPEVGFALPAAGPRVRASRVCAVAQSGGADGQGGPAAAMAGTQDMFDAIVMADERWVAGLAGIPALGGPLAAARALGERKVVLKAAGAGARGALDFPLRIGFSGERPAAPPDPPPPARGCPTHLLGLMSASLQGRRGRGWDGLCHLGAAPFRLLLRGRTYGSIHRQADKCVRRRPFPLGPCRGEPGVALCSLPAPGPPETSVDVSWEREGTSNSRPLTFPWSLL